MQRVVRSPQVSFVFVHEMWEEISAAFAPDTFLLRVYLTVSL